MSKWNGWNISLFMSSLTHDCACIMHQQISHGRFEHHLLESSETGNLFRSVNIRLRVKARRRVFLIYSPSSVDSPLMGAQCLRHESHFPLCEHVNQPLWVRHVSLALATHRCALVLQTLWSGDTEVLLLNYKKSLEIIENQATELVLVAHVQIQRLCSQLLGLKLCNFVYIYICTHPQSCIYLLKNTAKTVLILVFKKKVNIF